jgi:hypothetical protein
MTNVLFRETQRLKPWWVWLILLPITALMCVGIVRQLIMGIPFGSNPASDGGLIAISLLVFAFDALFLSMSLKTVIEEDGIFFRLFPITGWKKLEWSDVESIYTRKYKPLLEYGGWGLRYGNGKAYTMGGNQGIQIVTKSKKKILIGTAKPEEAEQVLAQFRSKYSISASDTEK